MTLILGDSEKDNEQISYRLFGEKDTTTLNIGEFIDYIINKRKNKE